MTTGSPDPTTTHRPPGARAPDRQRAIDAHGIRIAVHEWGDADAPPLALVHGGFDFARTFDVFAPLLADAGWRIIAWDQRGHGDSEHASLYSWSTDVRDAATVLADVSDQPLPIVGHSKGGSLMLEYASALPGRVSKLVNLDGLPSWRNFPDVADHLRTRLMAGDLAAWLDIRRSTVDAVRKPGTIDELASRRGKMNPRLSADWLRYLVTVGAREDHDGWRWKIDPALRLGGFGPWRPEWSMQRLALLGVPVLAVLGQKPELMGWGTRAEDVQPYLPPDGTVHELDDVGHFVHVERPQQVADMVLDFLGTPGTTPERRSPTKTLRHNRVELGLHCLRPENPDPNSSTDPTDTDDTDHTPAGTDRPLLLLHGLGGAAPATVPDHLAAWPGPIWALDFTGHGQSTVPAGGGYFSEVLMGDADMALAELGPCTVYGYGLGAYIALLLAGARPTDVRGAILDDGPGLHGGGETPSSSHILIEPLTDRGQTPDPYALMEMSRDLRPSDYATTFVRQAVTQSGLEVALAVVAAVRPPWLAAVAKEPGVEELSRAKALAWFADQA